MPETTPQEGIKYDTGKRRIAEMLTDFKDSIESVCEVWEFGANKYAKSNWKYVDNALDRYTNALLRHLLAEDVDPIDDESKLLHAAHVAWNALARLHFILEDLKKVDKEPVQLKLPLYYNEEAKPEATRYVFGNREDDSLGDTIERMT